MAESRFVIARPQRKQVFKQAKMTNKVPPLKGAGGCFFCLSLQACEAIQKKTTI